MASRRHKIGSDARNGGENWVSWGEGQEVGNENLEWEPGRRIKVGHSKPENDWQSIVIDFEIEARSPGSSTHTTLMRARGLADFACLSHCTSIFRSGSEASTRGQSAAWTVKPRPRVMKPITGSPGIGPQQRPNVTRMSSTSEILIAADS